MASARLATVLIVGPVREAVRVLLHDCPLKCQSIHMVNSVGGSALTDQVPEPALVILLKVCK